VLRSAAHMMRSTLLSRTPTQDRPPSCPPPDGDCCPGLEPLGGAAGSCIHTQPYCEQCAGTHHHCPTGTDRATAPPQQADATTPQQQQPKTPAYRTCADRPTSPATPAHACAAHATSMAPLPCTPDGRVEQGAACWPKGSTSPCCSMAIRLVHQRCLPRCCCCCCSTSTSSINSLTKQPHATSQGVLEPAAGPWRPVFAVAPHTAWAPLLCGPSPWM